MWTDPIVEEVRCEREAYGALLGYSLQALCTDLRRQEQESDQQLVTHLPRGLQKDANSGSPQRAQGVGQGR